MRGQTARPWLGGIPLLPSLMLCLFLPALSGCAEFWRWSGPGAHTAPSSFGEPPDEGSHVVRLGETVYSIAFRNQLDYHELAAWNDIGPDYLIRPGQVLRLTPPAGRSKTPVATAAEPPSSIQTYPINRPPEVPREQRGNYTWRWPTSGSVLKAYAPDNGSKGLDISGQLGQAVLAAAPGKVVYSGSALKGYGELIIIKHDELYLSAYGYNRKRLVAEGAVVAAGQAIAELGIGPEQKPVLHFEIREKGKPINPLTLLPPG